jgi:hypothetical protein
LKIALVQFYLYHEEVLAPQIDFLLPDNELFVAAPLDLFNHDYIIKFSSNIRKIIFSNSKYNNKNIMQILYRMVSIILKYLQLYKSIKQHNIDLIVFNTITRPFHFKLIRFLFKNIEKIHIIHNGQLFIDQKAIKSLSIFKKNLFISFDVYNYYINKHRQTSPIAFDWFFPDLFNFFISDKNYDSQISSNDKITIVVPGAVEDWRRNYEGLFDALKTMQITDPPFRIVLLGKISVDGKKQIADMGLNEIIKTYAAYVPGQEMLRCIRSADAIAFLVDKNIGENCCLYNRYKITGSSVLALSFGIPCIVSSDFVLDNGLKEKAVIYPESHIEYVFRDIITGKLSKKHFEKLKEKPLPEVYFPDYQRTHYRTLLGVCRT